MRDGGRKVGVWKRDSEKTKTLEKTRGSEGIFWGFPPILGDEGGRKKPNFTPNGKKKQTLSIKMLLA